MNRILDFFKGEIAKIKEFYQYAPTYFPSDNNQLFIAGINTGDIQKPDWLKVNELTNGIELIDSDTAQRVAVFESGYTIWSADND